MASLLPDLRAFARFLVQDRTAADDLVQDAVMRALAALDQFQPGSNLKAWMFTIVRNTFYEQLRRRKRERQLLDAHPQEDEGSTPEQHGASEIGDLQRMLWTLAPTMREALILIGVQELSYEEAAVICRVPVGTMKARVSRARTALSEAMQRDIGATGPS